MLQTETQSSAAASSPFMDLLEGRKYNLAIYYEEHRLLLGQITLAKKCAFRSSSPGAVCQSDVPGVHVSAVLCRRGEHKWVRERLLRATVKEPQMRFLGLVQAQATHHALSDSSHLQPHAFAAGVEEGDGSCSTVVL